MINPGKSYTTPGLRRMLKRVATLKRPIHVALCLAMILVCSSGCSQSKPRREFPRSVEIWREEGHVGRRISTEHYEVYSTVDDPEFEEALPVFLETAFDEYQKTLDAETPIDQKLTTYVFQSRQEWAVFARRKYPLQFPVYNLIRSGGFTDGNVSVLFFVDRASTFATMAHEGWHQYAAARYVQMPAWLNEGLACTFETFRWIDDRVVFEPLANTFRLNSLREAIKDESLITIRELLATNAGEVVSLDDSRFTQCYYAQAWAFVIFLRFGDKCCWAPGFKRLLADISDGSFKTNLSAQLLAEARDGENDSAHALVKAYFGTSLDKLEAAYRKYITDASRLTNP